MRTDKPTTTASASQNCAMAKDAALTGLPTLDPNDMPTEAQRRKWRNEYRKAKDGALKLIPAAKIATAGRTPEKVREEWRHPITGETREEMHAKRTKVTPQVKALDGMTPLGIPAEKPTVAQKLNNLATELHIQRDEARAHAAQLPWTLDERTSLIIDATGEAVTRVFREGKLIVASVNHAAQLAEALRRLVASPDVNADMLSPETIKAADVAREALAAYEESRQ